MINQTSQLPSIKVPGLREPLVLEWIVRLEGTANYTIIHLTDNKCLLVAKTLKFFEEEIPHFLRLTKADIVNPEYIERVTKLDSKNLFLLLKDGEKIRVSRRRITRILARLAV